MADVIEFNCDGVRASIRAVRERMENPTTVFKELARKIREDIKHNIAAGGPGFKPYAESTKKRLESTGTSQISRLGTVRSDRVKKTLKQVARIMKKIEKDGWNPAIGAKLGKLKKRAENYRKAEASASRRTTRIEAAEARLQGELSRGPLTLKEHKAAERARAIIEDSKKDRLGKRQASGHTLLGRIPGTIRSKLLDDGQTLYIYSKAGKVGAVHNAGSGKTPQRQFLPPPNMPEVMAYFKHLMESELGQAWDNPRGSAR